MTVSVENSTRSAIPPTLQSRLDDALADAAGLEVALEEEQKKVAELELKLGSVSSGVEYASEYAAHSKKRQAALDKALKKVKRRDDQIIKMKAAQAVLRDLHADLVIECIDANDKIAVQAQELVSLRNQVAACEQTLEAKHHALTTTIRARGDIITEQNESIKKLDAQLQALLMENARLKAAEYLHKRPSYVRGALSAVRAIGRLVANRGGVR